MKRPSTHSFREAEFEQLYRENVKRRKKWLSQSQSPFQPLFHVQHAVGGSEQAPLNLWSIVLLTDAPDPRYYEPSEQMVRAGLLPGFIGIYIERDIKLKLSRI